MALMSTSFLLTTAAYAELGEVQYETDVAIHEENHDGSHGDSYEEETVFKIRAKDKDGELNIEVNGKLLAKELDLPDDVVKVISKILKEVPELQHALTDEEREEIRESIKEGIVIDLGKEDDGGHGVSFPEMLIAIIAITFTLGMPVIIVALVLLASYRKRKQRKEVLEKLIESGQAITPELLDTVGAESSLPKNSLQKGLNRLGLGIGLFVFLGFISGWNIATVALIPIFIGIAHLVTWNMENKNN